jgi:O-antigen/teichoic acid export membrane protein
MTIHLAQSIILNILGLVYLVILAGLLNESDTGFFFVARAYIMILAATVSFALPFSITREISMHIEGGRRGAAKGVIISSVQYSIISGGIMAVSFLTVGNLFFAEFVQGNGGVNLLFVMSIDILAQSLLSVCSSILLGMYNFRALAVSSILSATIRYGPGLYAASIFRQVIHPISWWMIGDVFACIVMLALLLRHIGGVQTERTSILTLLRFSAPLLGSYYINSMYQQLERLAVAFFGGLVDAAAYGLASSFCTAFTSIYSSFSTSLYPTYSRNYESDGVLGALNTGHLVSKVLPVVYYPLVGIGLIAGPAMLNILLGTRYIATYPTFVILVLGTLVTCLTTAVTPPAIAIGRTRIVLLGDVLGFVAFLSAVFMSVIISPLLTVAIGRTLMVLISLFYVYWKVWKPHNVGLSWRSIGIQLVSILSASSIGILFVTILGLTYGTIFGILTASTFLVVLTRFTKVIKMQELVIITSILPSKLQNLIHRISAYILNE